MDENQMPDERQEYAPLTKPQPAPFVMERLRPGTFLQGDLMDEGLLRKGIPFNARRVSILPVRMLRFLVHATPPFKRKRPSLHWGINEKFFHPNKRVGTRGRRE